MPFDPDAYLKSAPAFDPDAYLGTNKKAANPYGNSPDNIDQLESGLRGLAQGASLGFADELTGGAEALGETLLGDRSLSDFGDVYKQKRDESRLAYEQAKAANPKTYMGAEIGGGIATAFVPGLGALNAAKGAQIGTVMGKGALQGGLMGLGGSSADDVKDMALDTAKGAALGAGGGAAGYGAGKFIGGVADSLADSKVGQYLLSKYKDVSGKIANSLQDTAEWQGARALGLERGTRNKLSTQQTRDVGRQALDEGMLEYKNLIPFMGGTDKLVKANEAIKTGAMADREAVYKIIDEAGASQFNPSEVAKNVMKKVLSDRDDKLLNPNYKDTQELIEKLRPEIENILSRGNDNIPMSEAQNLVSSLGEKARFDKTRTNDTQKMLKDIYGVVRNEINSSAEQAGQILDKAGPTRLGQAGAPSGPGLRQTVEQANKKFSVAKDAGTLLKNKQAREEGNKFLGLTDTVMGSNLDKMSAGAVLVKKVAEKYGNQTAAISADKLSKFVRESPELLGKYRPVLEKAIQRGGSSVAVTHHLLQQKDPEYRMKINGMDEEQ